jgi:hypothetical protein
VAQAQQALQGTPAFAASKGLDGAAVAASDENLPAAADSSAPDSPTAGAGPSGAPWHFSVTPYLWLPGIHGTAGAFDREVGVHANAIDLLSHFRFGLMGTVEARWKRFVLPLDIIWARLEDSKAVPYPGFGASTANMKASMFILTPKVGFRLLDQEKIKIDFVTGARYWHLGQNLHFSPSFLNLNFSRSQDWADPVVGGRIETPLTSKLLVNAFGDVGGWGTGSQLEYQVGGALGFRVKENVTLQAGYRYLDVNYRGGAPARFVFDNALSGIMLGVTINLK